MIYSDKILAQTIVALCEAKNLKHIIISPGSRSAPLTVTFSENPFFNCYSIVDERCAAFFALGIAQQTKQPVALVSTSGSALLNYYPAIAEAFYSDIPLVVISADRPADYLDIGDGQTIRQENVYKNHILYSANCKEGDNFQIENETLINTAIDIASEISGPVHINCPFSEPLYHTVENKLIYPQNVPYETEKTEFSEDLNPFLENWNKALKKMILVGVLPPNSIEQQILEKLLEDKSVLVLSETTSNLHHSNIVTAIDQLIAPLNDEDFINLQPEILLTFGGMVISKKIKAFLRTFSPQKHFHVDSKKAYDTFFVLDEHFKTDANTFLKAILPDSVKVESSYQKDWISIKEKRLAKHIDYLKEIPYSDFMAFEIILGKMPNAVQLQLANSATIRYAQLYIMNKNTDVYCNRGTSGIDGCTSTAIGAAVVSEKPTVFITGDLAFIYDSNALWNNYIPKNFKIIVINNHGGGIFRILPGDKNSENFKTYFETEHSLTAEQLCKMYDFEYHSATDKASLTSIIDSFYSENNKPQLLEIFTPADLNDKILLDYFKFIR